MDSSVESDSRNGFSGGGLLLGRYIVALAIWCKGHGGGLSISMAICGFVFFLQISGCKCIYKEASFDIFYCGFGVFPAREHFSSVGVLSLVEF